MVTAIALSLAFHGAILLLPAFSAAPSATLKTAIQVRLPPLETAEIKVRPPEDQKRPVITASGDIPDDRAATAPLREEAAPQEEAPPAVNSPASLQAYSPRAQQAQSQAIKSSTRDDSPKRVSVQKGASDTDGTATTATLSTATALHQPAAPGGNSSPAIDDSSPRPVPRPNTAAQLDFFGRLAALPPKGAPASPGMGTLNEKTSDDRAKFPANTSNNEEAKADDAIEPRRTTSSATGLPGAPTSSVESGENAQIVSAAPTNPSNERGTGIGGDDMGAGTGNKTGDKAGRETPGALAAATPERRLSIKGNSDDRGYSSDAAQRVSESSPDEAAAQTVAGTGDLTSTGTDALASTRTGTLTANPAMTQAGGTINAATEEPPEVATGGKIPAVPATPEPQTSTHVISAQEIMDFLSAKLSTKKVYPEAAQQRRIEGKVRIGMSIAPDGSLASVRVLEKSGSAILDRAALALVSGVFPIPLQPGNSMEIAVTIEYKLLQ